MAVDVSPTGSVGRENAFTASYRAEWAHFQAAIAGEAKVPVAQGTPHPAQGARRDLSLGVRWARCGVVRRGGGAAGQRGSLALRRAAPDCLDSATSLRGSANRPAAPPPRRPAGHRADRLPHDHGARQAGVGAVRPQRHLDPRSDPAEPIRPTITVSSISPAELSPPLRSGPDVVLDAGIPRRVLCRVVPKGQPVGLGAGARDRARGRGASCSEFLEWNERPENRFYHYDYYRDNCSTRVRDALDRALGGAIRGRYRQRRPPGKPTAFTPCG